ncbi:hypothetical protein TSAR_014645 [Trichomalopsis sarcophagae]|uniref:HTH OST-type domain-containing protein n=1 Tax=Trichomalopsis sarcophagae TaxID=543379 RepID=A0A232EH44_9HYME|nr:hypothetical protein TSAR_014645 [Trichomalopsis sarcophagae]
MAPSLATLDGIKSDIRCLLISRNSKNITLEKLNKMYKDVVDEDIPYKDFYFTSLEKFLRSMPDVLSLRLNQANELCAYHIDTEKSQHISSLVAREKPEADSSLRSKFKVYHANPIDPRILSEVLQELKNSPLHEKKKITDVLSAVVKHVGRYAFYTIKDLNSQLNECTHLLTHDDNYIHFKDNTPASNNVISLKNMQTKNAGSKLKDISNQMTKIVDLSSVGNLIKESTKIRLRKLIEKHVEGIWCSELPQIYQREYGISLEYSDLGFNSIVDFASALPDIFQIVKPLNSKRLMLLNSKICKGISENHNASTSTFNKCIEETPYESGIISTPMLDKYYKALIPDDVMAFNDSVDQIRVNELLINPIENSYHVLVSEVHNPSFFWVTLCQNKKKISCLINKLQNFYARENHNYKIPHEILKPGLNVTCIFAEAWHRGIIKKFKSDGLVVVHFYDYGTSSSFDPDQLYFLNKQFSTLPAQAIPCCLNNVKPLGTVMWSKKINKIFTEKVFDKSFSAHIIHTDDKNNSLVVDLVDKNNDINERYMSLWMIANKLAEHGKFICQIKNTSFTHYKECWNQNPNEKLNVT